MNISTAGSSISVHTMQTEVSSCCLEKLTLYLLFGYFWQELENPKNYNPEDPKISRITPLFKKEEMSTCNERKTNRPITVILMQVSHKGTEVGASMKYGFGAKECFNDNDHKGGKKFKFHRVGLRSGLVGAAPIYYAKSVAGYVLQVITQRSD